VDAREEREADGRDGDAGPRRRRDARAEEGERDQRREHDVHPGDEAGAGHRRPLEPRRLQRIAGGEQQAEQRAPSHAHASERPDTPGAWHRKRERRDREPHREEGEQGIERDRVLDLHERDAPDGRHRDQGREREHVVP
jgi:hypothetical protein